MKTTSDGCVAVGELNANLSGRSVGTLVQFQENVSVQLVAKKKTGNENFHNVNLVFCSTLSEFENVLLCERILINVTTCQNKTSIIF
jgi:hypothetical protein